ncbi:DUF190 domain-containing protein [Legionella longbeachae]|uniref:Uncharacterized protein n=1 Tax=Legionella longbeachae serogroup 1 (strain NSW150) TaxID=661367 RepID=D3HM16_LEGLN|nr:DUF190 domain-containing protein [Legionella longbeachae]VEE03930.1 Uncharacterized ACR, COG1993 [Legionella oakridgensis]HBD7397290.1 DUF190 domain-containing protein [Legionella pneumophila]ARB93214.1 hypothetical protein A6J40_13985 [Legionella longbeachae]ARM33722.1 DUF190 domain-containing protein [Legionella longbeachae]EEZ97124.1 conserved hypothetical protein [Legionella longbeachae D-4968]
MNHVKISVYINERDKWQHRPLHLELLNMLDENGIAGGTVLRGVAGFTFKAPIVSTSLVDIGSKLPLVVHFVDSIEKAELVLPKIKEMAKGRLITREIVEVISGAHFDIKE